MTLKIAFLLHSTYYEFLLFGNYFGKQIQNNNKKKKN